MWTIHWFRRDLRIADNIALANACSASHGYVLPVFILDDKLLKGKDVASGRIHFMLESLRVLDKNLRQRGSRLIIRRGDPTIELAKLASECNASALFFNRDYTPYARKRDASVTDALHSNGVNVQSFDDAVIHSPDALLTNGDKPCTVYTPYKNKWLALPKPAVFEFESYAFRAPNVNVASLPIPTMKELGMTLTQTVPAAGEDHAHKLLNQFIDEQKLAHYAQNRDFPALDCTSHLSPHLRFGTISPRLCYHNAINARMVTVARETISESALNTDTWISELIWREFYIQVLYHHPDTVKEDFKKEYAEVQWGSGNPELDQKRFEAWCAGKTGVPIVDAAMRQLNHTGWMHNRCRMIVASFLTKDLLIHWRKGESYFMKNLVDGDPASNIGGWQWAASTGTDAQPYFRVFNPWLQAEKFDQKGAYIRKWVPELARVPEEYIHNLGAMSPIMRLQTNVILGQTYPLPIVDHYAQKDIMLLRFKKIKS
jgi:deoxyribodipyrimidine photo-lyase